MKNSAILLLVFLVFSCKNEPSNTATQTTGTTPEATSAAPSGDPGYGIPGTDKPRITENQDSTVYAYSQYKVATVADAEKAGESITVFSADGQVVWKLENNDHSNFFSGITGDFVLVDKGTGPDGRVILVHDLKSNKTLLQANYISDMTITDNSVLSFYRRAPKTMTVKANCPDKAKWEQEGFGVGYGQLHYFELATGKITSEQGFECFPVQ